MDSLRNLLALSSALALLLAPSAAGATERTVTHYYVGQNAGPADGLWLYVNPLGPTACNVPAGWGLACILVQPGERSVDIVVADASGLPVYAVVVADTPSGMVVGDDPTFCQEKRGVVLPADAIRIVVHFHIITNPGEGACTPTGTGLPVTNHGVSVTTAGTITATFHS